MYVGGIFGSSISPIWWLLNVHRATILSRSNNSGYLSRMSSFTNSFEKCISLVTSSIICFASSLFRASRRCKALWTFCGLTLHRVTAGKVNVLSLVLSKVIPTLNGRWRNCIQDSYVWYWQNANDPTRIRVQRHRLGKLLASGLHAVSYRA